MFRRRAVAAVFWPLLAVWTWKLVEPNPFPETGAALGPWAYLAAKALHGSAYAFLAAVGVLWPAGPRGRLAVAVGLLSHGAGSEIAQTFVPGRSGRALDVAIDWAGVLVGLAVVRYGVWCRLKGGPIFPTSRGGPAGFSG
jgi:hypothetical protein